VKGRQEDFDSEVVFRGESSIYAYFSRANDDVDDVNVRIGY